MATYAKLPSGRWRAQVRRRGRHASKTFRLKADAENWARVIEANIDEDRPVQASWTKKDVTFGALIDQHIADMTEVGKPPRRSKCYTLTRLKLSLGKLRLCRLDRARLLDYGKERAKEGAGPVTLSAEIGYVRTILVHAAAVHGVPTPIEEIALARVAMRRLGLIGKGRARDRRPSDGELARIIHYVESNPRQSIPVGRIIKFAVATAMRQEEICLLTWSDIDFEGRMATVRNRKDPRSKDGNDQLVPLIAANGYDPIDLLREQREASPKTDRVFPYNSKSVGAVFTRTCQRLSIKNLRFHDLRHEATSRLFEAGLDIPEVSLVTGHKDWAMLRRYMNLQPHQLVTHVATPRYNLRPSNNA